MKIRKHIRPGFVPWNSNGLHLDFMLLTTAFWDQQFNQFSTQLIVHSPSPYVTSLSMRILRGCTEGFPKIRVNNIHCFSLLHQASHLLAEDYLILVKHNFFFLYLCWLLPIISSFIHLKYFPGSFFPSSSQGLRWGWPACHSPYPPPWISVTFTFSSSHEPFQISITLQRQSRVASHDITWLPQHLWVHLFRSERLVCVHFTQMFFQPDPHQLKRTLVFLALDLPTDFRGLEFLKVNLINKECNKGGTEYFSLFCAHCYQVLFPFSSRTISPCLPLSAHIAVEAFLVALRRFISRWALAFLTPWLCALKSLHVLLRSPNSASNTYIFHFLCLSFVKSPSFIHVGLLPPSLAFLYMGWNLYMGSWAWRWWFLKINQFPWNSLLFGTVPHVLFGISFRVSLARCCTGVLRRRKLCTALCLSQLDPAGTETDKTNPLVSKRQPVREAYGISAQVYLRKVTNCQG